MIYYSTCCFCCQDIWKVNKQWIYTLYAYHLKSFPILTDNSEEIVLFSHISRKYKKARKLNLYDLTAL